ESRIQHPVTKVLLPSYEFVGVIEILSVVSCVARCAEADGPLWRTGRRVGAAGGKFHSGTTKSRVICSAQHRTHRTHPQRFADSFRCVGKSPRSTVMAIAG